MDALEEDTSFSEKKKKKKKKKNFYVHPHFSFPTFGFITNICIWTYGL